MPRPSSVPDLFRAVYRARGQVGETPAEAFGHALNLRGASGVAMHSPKLSKVTRRKRRLASLTPQQRMMRVINKVYMYRNGIEKWRTNFWSRAEDPVYERPRRAERSGPRRKQQRVRGRLQPMTRPRPAARERRALA